MSDAGFLVSSGQFMEFMDSRLPAADMQRIFLVISIDLAVDLIKWRRREMEAQEQSKIE
jgi:hypothetical protein